MNKDFIAALEELEKEKRISKEQTLEALSRALVSAYKSQESIKDRSRERFLNREDEESSEPQEIDNTEYITADIDEATGEIQVLHTKIVVPEVTDPDREYLLSDAQEIDPDYEAGDEISFPVPVENFTRIAAQIAKQVVMQAIRDAERGLVYEEYKDKQGDLITGVIQRAGFGAVYVTIGRTEGILSKNEQVRKDRYTENTRMKFLLLEVKNPAADEAKRAEDQKRGKRPNKKGSQGGPQLFLSRSHPDLVRRLFELEVPELREGIISIERLAREAGSRTKIGVMSFDESVDPVGSCVGNRGVRVQAVVDELMDEKIDIIPWSEDVLTNIKNALAPAGVEKILFDEEENQAVAIVPDFQLSLAIGKEGQNVRLAAKLCGVKIDIKSHSQYYSSQIDENLTASLDEEGFYNPADFVGTDDDFEEKEAELEQAEFEEAVEEGSDTEAPEAEVEVTEEALEVPVDEVTEEKEENDEE
ncbi:MAG: transcription termination/antitermination protein NusA [Clostridiales Family XIII bacterium]|jgi:N utilization substance protein A|nr:transcription termination/antitermination protein NusA [Clostridiales Family XIII bacterium]